MAETEERSLDGQQVMEIRKRAKLTRVQFSAMCGFEGKTTSRLTTIETRNVWKRGDWDKIKAGLAQLEEQLFDPENPVDQRIIELRKSGLTSGQIVVVAEGRKLSEEPVEIIIPEEEWPDDIAIVTRETAPIEADEEIRVVDWPYEAFRPVAPLPVETQPLPPLPEGAVRVSAGMLASWKRCKRQWWLQWYLELGLRHEDLTSARAIGGRVHRALAAYYVPEGQTPSDPRDALERAIVDDWTRLADAIRQGPQSDEVDARLEAVAAHYNDVVSLERAMVKGYVEWLGETGIDSDLKVIESEQPRAAMIEANVAENSATQPKIIPVQIVSLQDTRVIRTTDGVRLFLDHKTAKDLTSPLPMLKGNPQMLHYHLVEWLNSAEGEARCDGALYNMLRKVKRTTRATPPFYHREPIMHNAFQIDAYRRQLLGAVRDMVQLEEALRAGADPIQVAYPTWVESCKWDCDFYSICPLFDDGSPGLNDMQATLYQKVDVWSRYERLNTSDEGSRDG